MRIKAPSNSIEMTRAVLDAGADELYVGLPSSEMKNITLSGRGNKTASGRSCQLNNGEELKKIIEEAKKREVRVDYTLNNPFIVSDASEELLITQILQAVEAGIDAFIVADLYVGALVKKFAPKTKLCASSFFDIYNRQTIDLLEREGYDRVILAYDLSLDELKVLNKNKKIEYEIFGHFGCSLKLGPCLLLHGTGENLNLGIPCRNMYNVRANESKKLENEMPLIDSAKDCSICSLKKLIDLDIDVIKIIGRGKDTNFIASIIYVYRKIIDELMQGKDIEEVRKNIILNVPWWNEVFCKHARCKYKDTIDSKFTIV